jgi:hypothetical protein
MWMGGDAHLLLYSTQVGPCDSHVGASVDHRMQKELFVS